MRTWLSRNLIIITLISLAQDAASELIYPLLPILVAGAVGAAAGAGEVRVPDVELAIGAVVGMERREVQRQVRPQVLKEPFG